MCAIYNTPEGMLTLAAVALIAYLLGMWAKHIAR